MVVRESVERANTTFPRGLSGDSPLNESLISRTSGDAASKTTAGAGLTLEAKRLRSALVAMAVLYAIYTAVLALTPSSRNETLAYLAAATALNCGLFGFILHWNSSETRLSRWLGSFIASLSVLNPLAHLLLVRDPIQTTHLIFLLLGASFALSSTLRFMLIWAVSLSAWLFITFPNLQLPEWQLYGYALAAGAFVSLGIQTVRAAGHRREPAMTPGEAPDDDGKFGAGSDRWQLAVRGTNDGLWSWDLATDELHLSPRWKSMLGYREEEVDDKLDEWFSRVHPYYHPALKKALADHIRGDTEQFELKYRIRHRDGTYRWALSRGAAARGADGKVQRIAGSQTDITALIEVEKHLIHDALHDTLTGLPNRGFLMRQLETVTERQHLFAVLFMDLDRFKIINDTLGHEVGDQLLMETAKRLDSGARTGDIVARLGGDEFVIVLNGLRQAKDAEQLASRLQKIVQAPLELAGNQFTPSASIGIAIADGASSADQLLRNADIAMYEAKTHKGKIRVFSTDMRGRLVRSWQLQNDLRHALERDELRLHYQPLVSLETGRIEGAEALIRWQRDEGELLSALDVIPHAEDMGLIGEIGEWVLRTACQCNSVWRQAKLPPVSMSVNVSARQLRRDDFAKTVKRIVEQSGMRPSMLELELTESALMENEDLAASILADLSNQGIRLALDDFGTGYSSLEYLRRFPFNTLKIGQSFVAGIPHDHKSAALLEGIVATAHKLDLRVIAEGVETEKQLSFLRSRDCDWIQGYLASRPVTGEKFSELLGSRERILPESCGFAEAESLKALSHSSEKSNQPAFNGGGPNGAKQERDPFRRVGLAS